MNFSFSKTLNFFQIFDVDARRIIFEQELYNEMVYKVPERLFHTFEADDCVAGISFVSGEEADVFRQEVDSRQRKRQTRFSNRLL